MLENMPKDNVKAFEKTLLFSREQVFLSAKLDRKSHNSGTII